MSDNGPMIPESDEQVALVGGPCDGWKVPPFVHQISVPICQGAWARMGDSIDEVAVYELGITGLRAYFKSHNQ